MIGSFQKLFEHEFLIFLGLFSASLLIAYVSVFILIDYFRRQKIVAEPGQRSMHSEPTPVGGGWAIIPLTLSAWVGFNWPVADFVTWSVFSGVLLLALVSWVDDKQLLHPLLRFTVQAGVIALVLLMLPGEKVVFFEGWPLWIDRIITGLCWLWFVNLFNFMDGIDGLAGMEILFICAGIIFIGLQIGASMPMLHIVTVLAGATAGFLWWNWHPARVFLGDVGSISIGFLLGWLLIQMAMDGYLVAAFLLPAYFVADASLALTKRALKREPFWKPHKTHFYQRAAMGLQSHAVVVWNVMAANAALFGLAIAAIYQPAIAAIGGIGVVVLILFVLERHAVK